jgi:hypothetical protein
LCAGYISGWQTGGWGTSFSAWGKPNSSSGGKQPSWDTAEQVPINTAGSAANMSEVDLGAHHAASNTAAVAASNRFSMPWQIPAGAPAYPAAAGADSASVAAQEAALSQKEAALKAKEKELLEREAELRRNGGMAPRKNWPLCFPIIHHDIAKDIPAGSQGAVRLAYWWATWWNSMYKHACSLVQHQQLGNSSLWRSNCRVGPTMAAGRQLADVLHDANCCITEPAAR